MREEGGFSKTSNRSKRQARTSCRDNSEMVPEVHAGLKLVLTCDVIALCGTCMTAASVVNRCLNKAW